MSLVTFKARSRAIILALAFAMPSAGISAQTQDLSADGTDPFGEIVITATRKPDSLGSVPGRVDVITSEQIADSGAGSVPELLESLAGITITNLSGNPSGAALSMKGFGEYSFGRVLVLVDGFRLNNPDMSNLNWLQLPLSSIDRIEVLQGGASSVYGDNAVAGVVNIISRTRADAGVSVDARAGYGSFGTNSESISVSAPVGGTSLLADYSRRDSEGQRDRSAYSSNSGGLRASGSLGETTEWKAAASVSFSTGELPGSLTEAQYEADPDMSVNPADSFGDDLVTFSAGIESFPGDRLSLRLPAMISRKNLETVMTSWFSYSRTRTDSLKLPLSAGYRHGAGSLLEGEVSAGADIQVDRFNLRRYPDASFGTASTEVDVEKFQRSAWLRESLTPAESLRFDLGLRREWATITGDSSDIAEINADKTHAVFTWDAGISYRPVNALKFFAQGKRIFRIPFIDEQMSYYGYGSDSFIADLEAETGHDLSLGIECAPADGVTIGANAFCMIMDNEIAFDGAANANLDRTRRLGAGLTLKAAPGDTISINLDYAYTNAVFIRGSNEGKRIPLVPGHKANAAVSVELPLGFTLSSDAELVGGFHQGGDLSNSLEPVASAFRAGAALAWKAPVLDGLTLRFEARNLTDDRTPSYVYYSGYYPNDGRSLSLSARFRR